MCFSATASFSASVIIGTIGMASLLQCKSRDERYLGTVPILFACQQFSEGFVWLSLTNPSFHAFQHVFSVFFLFFAWVVWPILIPLALFKLEKDSKRRRWMQWLIIIGVISACGAFLILVLQHPSPSIATFHIIYNISYSAFRSALFIPRQTIYVLATVLPLFLSSVKGTKILAICNGIALIFCFYLFQDALPSTWCFFAALLSVIIYWIIRNLRRKQTLNYMKPSNVG